MFRVGIYGMENQVLMSEIVKNRKKRNKKEKIKDQSRRYYQDKDEQYPNYIFQIMFHKYTYAGKTL